MDNDTHPTIERPCLYLVATPIGNLGDFSHRAIAVLREVDWICAEDTRTSQRLLDHYAVVSKLESLHEKNESDKADSIVARILGGPAAVALMSDAGTPLVSDPGFRLTQAAHDAGIPVRSIPGASAILAGLTVAGLPLNRFAFEGFLPARRAARLSRLQELIREARTCVFFEAPHRVRETLDDMAEVFGLERPAFVGRELTKQFETHYRGNLREVLSVFNIDPYATRGEFVIVIGAASEIPADNSLASNLLVELIKYVSPRDAVNIVTATTATPRNVVYELALAIKGSSKSD